MDIDYRTRIFGSILWSHIKSDFSDKKLPVNSVDLNENCGSGLWINRAHFTSLYEIDKIIRISTLEDKDLIILTHYGPSMMCVEKETHHTPYLASENDRYFITPPVKFWVYGHTGYNIDKMIGNLRLVSNQICVENYSQEKVLEVNNKNL